MNGLAALRSPDLPSRLRPLGFGEDDVTDTVRAARTVLTRPRAVARLLEMIRHLRERLGAFLADPAARPTDPFADDDPALTEDLGPGVLPLLALVATGQDTHEWHLARGIDPTDSHATLADLGRQTAQHRRVHGHFGLEATDRLLTHWQGSLYHLGRLQLDLQPVPATGRRAAALPPALRGEEWVLAVHIPPTGPLRHRAVDASLDRAPAFFEKHLDGVRPRYARCISWLLDPYLATVLPPDAHVARFQDRFTPYGTPSDGTADVLFHVFGTRDPDDLAALPRDTAIRRIVLDRIAAGDAWHLVQGYTALT